MADLKISQLSVLTSPLASDVLPVVNDGETKQISVGDLSMMDVTFEQIHTLWNNEELIPGQHYKITDYQTCYDQPNFSANRDEITTGNYKSGSIEELVVFATSNDTLSPNVYSLDYPKDTIKYDISFNATEVTDGLAKGRIYERIDEVGNRTDYDWRTVVFKRYRQYYAENVYDGTVTINTTETTGSVIGVGTDFQNVFSVGDVLGVYNTDNSRIGGFDFYEIVDISGSYYMGITGSYYSTISDTYYSIASDYSGLSPFQTNTVTVGKDEYLYTTFAEEGTPAGNDWYNNYLGDNTDWETFRLSNNVFREGTYKDNYFGSNVVGNTFDDDCHGNKCGRNFKYDSIGDDFDNNTIGDSFQYNFSVADIQENIIGNNFEYNMIADDDGIDFNYNIINGDRFAHNWTIGYDDFSNNIITDDFYDNVIHGAVENNLMNGRVYNNLFDGDIINNQIKGNFYANKIESRLRDNIIGNFTENITLSNVERNQFGSFAAGNILSGSVNDNVIGNNFTNNVFNGVFSNNQIGTGFQNNEIGDSFGIGYGDPRANKIGNNFANNTIGEYFYSNTISDNFSGNTTGDYFQQNTVFANNVNNVDFTVNYGNITSIGAPVDPNIGGTDGTYNSVDSTMDGHGVGAQFDVVVTNGTGSVSLNQGGKLYLVGNMINITGSLIGGGLDLRFAVDSISTDPVVYQYFDTTIVRDIDQNLKATYLTSGGLGQAGITEQVD